MLARLAVVYALGVALACPAVLHADGAQAPAPPGQGTAQPADETTTAEAQPPPQGEPAPAPQTPPKSASQPAPAAPAARAAAPSAPVPPSASAPEEAAAPTAVAAAGSVSIRDFAFSPAAVTVTAGDSVTWVNTGKESHTATGDGFNTGTLKSGRSGSHTFASAGTFSYQCTIHPQMHGTVKVVAAASNGGGGSGSRGGSGASSGGGAGTSPAGSQTAGGDASASAGAGGPRLASTGLDAWLLAAIGVGMLAAGIGLRRRVEAP